MEVQESWAGAFNAIKMNGGRSLDRRDQASRKLSRGLTDGLGDLEHHIALPIAVFSLSGGFEREATGRLGKAKRGERCAQSNEEVVVYHVEWWFSHSMNGWSGVPVNASYTATHRGRRLTQSAHMRPTRHAPMLFPGARTWPDYP